MTCPICLKEFTPRTKQQRYCKKACSDKAHNPKRRSKAKEMLVEWLAWNQDFKLGKTASNL
ncbi:MAG: hypothetical protein II968_05175 [Selenomonadaceae bacterium]|nr:hypothetical protein [Selenomonadaceae bacterium]